MFGGAQRGCFVLYAFKYCFMRRLRSQLVSSQNEAVDFDYLVKVALTATTFLVYDTLIHVGDEVEYIWK